MNSIISFLNNSTLIFSFVLFTFSVNAHDQIDYAVNLVEQDPFALFENMTDQDLEENTDGTIGEKASLFQVSEITPPKTRQMYGRESITFILGKDTNAKITFYDEAFYYICLL